MKNRTLDLKRLSILQALILFSSMVIIASLPSAAAVDTPPIEDVRSVGEFEKMDYLLLRWGGGGVVPPIMKAIINGVEDSVQVYLVCDSSGDMSSAQNYLATQGVPLVNVTFIVYNGDSIWMRDYGPNFIMFPNGSIGMVDLHYYNTRPQDDAFPNWFSGYAGYPNHVCDLYYEGGNYMSDGINVSWSTNEIFLDNPSLTQAEVSENITDYFGANAHKTLTKQSGDGTGHIDMFCKLLDIDKVLVAQHQPTDANYQILENNVQYLENQTASNGNPFTIYRVPTIRSGGTFYTYTNSLIVNNRVLLPVYNLPQDSIAVATYQEAMPGYQIISIDCSGMISWGGAIHCITMTIPGHDTTPPEIDHIPVAPKPVYTPMNITAQVRDDVRVKSVWLTYTDVHGAPHNESMNRWSFDNYSYDIPAQDWPGTLNYKIHAEDCARITTTDINNWKQTPSYDVPIIDMQPPTIEHDPVTTTTVSDPIEISALVADDFELATVALNYTDINDTTHIVPMTLGSTHHSTTIPAQGYFGTIEYRIEAWDGDDNHNWTAPYTVTVKDVIPPVIMLHPPSSTLTDNVINITATVSDDVGIDEVVLIWSPPTGGTFNDSMGLLDPGENGWVYAMDIPAQVKDGNITCHAGVADLYGHWSFTPEYGIDVMYPNRPPLIGNPAPLSVLEDSWINITIDATDPDIGDKLEFEVESPLEKYHGLTLDPDTGEMSFRPTNEHVGVWQLNFTVRDFDGLTSKCTTNLTVINTNDDPVLFAQDMISGEEDTPIRFMLLAEDEDLLVEGEDVLTFTSTENQVAGVVVQIEPVNGSSANPSAMVTVSLPENNHGTFDLGFKVDDGQGGSDSAEVQIMVVPVQDPPKGGGIAYPKNGSSFPNGSSISLVANEASDPDYDILEYMWQSDTDGILGWGVNLTTMLSIGKHNITLTITDGTFTITIPPLMVIIEPPPDDADEILSDDDLPDSGDVKDGEKGEGAVSSSWLIIAIIIAIGVALLLTFLLVYNKKRREQDVRSPHYGHAYRAPPVAMQTSGQMMTPKPQAVVGPRPPSPALGPAPLALPAAKGTEDPEVVEPPRAHPSPSEVLNLKGTTPQGPNAEEGKVSRPEGGGAPTPVSQPRTKAPEYPKYRRT